MKQTLKGKKVLLLPNTKSTDLIDNENLLTNTIIKMTNMLQGFEVESVTLNQENEYDVVVARHINTYETNVINLVKTKPALIFNYDSINAGWWFSESIDEDGNIFSNEVRTSSCSIDCVENPYWDIETKHPIK